MRPQDRFVCPELLLEGLVPTPGESVSLHDIVDFRERHRDELLAFRAAVDEAVQAILRSDNPVDWIRTERERIERSLREVLRAARARRIRLATGTASVLILGAACHSVAPEAVPWVYSGAGAGASMSILSRALRRDVSFPRLSYLLRAQNQLGG